MRVVVMGDREAYRAALPDNPLLDSPDTVFVGRSAGAEELARACPDAEALLFDAIARVDAQMIAALPRLRLMCSEGVGYEGVDLQAAREAGVFVCNNHGGNAGAVAEQAVLLMLGVLRNVAPWDEAVRQGRQMQVKLDCLKTGRIRDLANCTVGLVGMGDIAQATAARLAAFGARVLYWSRTRCPARLEEGLGVSWATMDDLLARCDLVSLHVPSTPQTRGMVDDGFLARMRPGSYLINTARGDLVDSAALARALEVGAIAGAGLDTVAPEPVEADNPLLGLSPKAADRLLLSPHIGGITAGSMRRMQAHMWENVRRVERGERPDGIVNGL